jgi:hypothetical protein
VKSWQNPNIFNEYSGEEDNATILNMYLHHVKQETCERIRQLFRHRPVYSQEGFKTIPDPHMTGKAVCLLVRFEGRHRWMHVFKHKPDFEELTYHLIHQDEDDEDAWTDYEDEEEIDDDDGTEIEDTE